MRVNILLACTECKRRNYATVKNKKNTTGRVELKKAVALTARAAVSKTACWGFESLLPCHFHFCRNVS